MPAVTVTLTAPVVESNKDLVASCNASTLLLAPCCRSEQQTETVRSLLPCCKVVKQMVTSPCRVLALNQRHPIYFCLAHHVAPSNACFIDARRPRVTLVAPMYFLLPSKESKHADVGDSLRSAIHAELGEHDASTPQTAEACRLLSLLRLKSCQFGPAHPHDQLRTRQAYLSAVAFLITSPEIPSLRHASPPPSLTWTNAFSSTDSLTVPDLLLDHISTRWNVAAATCDLALFAFRDATDAAATQEALNGARRAFQATAGLFDNLANSCPFDFPSPPTSDLSRTSLNALHNAFLANAQLASYFYCDASGVTAHNISAKVVAGARDFYLRAARNASAAEIRDTPVARSLGRHVAVLVQFCDAESHYQTEMSLGDPEDAMPERLARARESVAALDRADALLADMRDLDTTDVHNSLVHGVATRAVVIRARAVEVARQNSFIYHASEMKAVDPVVGRQMNFTPAWDDCTEGAENSVKQLPQALARTAEEAAATAAEETRRVQIENERMEREVREKEKAAALEEAHRRARAVQEDAKRKEDEVRLREAQARQVAARERERHDRERELRERKATEASEAAERERQCEAQRVSNLIAQEKERATIKRGNEEEYRKLAQATVGAQKDKLRPVREALLNDIANAERAVDGEESSYTTVSRVGGGLTVDTTSARPEGVIEEDAFAAVRSAVQAGGLSVIEKLQGEVKALAMASDKKIEAIRAVLAKEATDSIEARRKAASFGLPVHQESSVLTKGMFERLEKISISVKKAHDADRTIEDSIGRHREKLVPLAGLDISAVQPGAAVRAASHEHQLRLVLSAKSELYNALRTDLAKARQMVEDEASLSCDFDLLLAEDDPQASLSSFDGSSPILGMVQAKYGGLCEGVSTFIRQVSSTRENLRRGLSNIEAARKKPSAPAADPMEIVWKNYAVSVKHALLCKYLNEGKSFYVGENSAISCLLDESRTFAATRARQAEDMAAPIRSRRTSSTESATQQPNSSSQYVSAIQQPSHPNGSNQRQHPAPLNQPVWYSAGPPPPVAGQPMSGSTRPGGHAGAYTGQSPQYRNPQFQNDRHPPFQHGQPPPPPSEDGLSSEQQRPSLSAQGRGSILNGLFNRRKS